jgi:YfiH family protein
MFARAKAKYTNAAMWTIEQSSLGRIAVPPDLPRNLAVFCTTRDFRGDIVADEIVSLVQRRFGIETSLTTCTQVHGTTVARARRDSFWRECDSCDALWSSEPGTSLAIKIADCLPVTIADPEHRVIANIHAGWRGAAAGILRRTLDTLLLSGRFDPDAALAWLGPSIRVCCFEVGEEVAVQFEGFVDRDRTKPHVDLISHARAILEKGGIAADRISDSELCTRCEGSIFHSYRREGPGAGRNLAIAAQ